MKLFLSVFQNDENIVFLYVEERKFIAAFQNLLVHVLGAAGRLISAFLNRNDAYQFQLIESPVSLQVQIKIEQSRVYFGALIITLYGAVSLLKKWFFRLYRRFRFLSVLFRFLLRTAQITQIVLLRFAEIIGYKILLARNTTSAAQISALHLNVCIEKRTCRRVDHFFIGIAAIQILFFPEDHFQLYFRSLLLQCSVYKV